MLDRGGARSAGERKGRKIVRLTSPNPTTMTSFGGKIRNEFSTLADV